MNFLARTGRWRWSIVAMLFSLSLVNYLDRQTLSVLAPYLRDRFGMTNQQYSYVVAAFLVAYTFGFGICAPVLNRFGVRITLAAAVIAWSCAGMLHSLATGWIGLAVCRFALGIGESFGPVGGAKAIGDWSPHSERSLSMAMFSTGNIAGAILAPPLVTAVLIRFGWQPAFVVTGAAGILWAVVWLRFYQSPQASGFLSASERTLILSQREPEVSKGAIHDLLRDRMVYALFFARFLTDSVPFFFSFWLPEYLHRSRAFSLTTVGFVAWIPYLAADLGGLSGGAISDWLLRHGFSPQRARMTALLGAACTTPLAILAARADSAVMALGCIALVLAAHSCWIVNLFTVMTETFPRSQISNVIGISGIGAGLGGMVANLATGGMVAKHGYAPIFTVLGFVHGAAYLLLRWNQQGRFEVERSVRVSSNIDHELDDAE
jgi:ACS family hexuronate transporter-like MFS transporter